MSTLAVAAETALLDRSLERLTGDPLLIVEPPDVESVRWLREQLDARIEVFTTTLDIATAIEADVPDVHVSFGPWFESHAWSQAVVYLPQGKARQDMTLAMLANAPRGLEVLLVGHKRAGAQSSGARMQRVLDDVEKLDAARHCTLWRGSTRAAPASSLDDWARAFTAPGAPPLEVISLPGVFSHGAVDDGTRRLLDHLDLGSPRRVLDLCCGAGLIGATVARQHPDAIVHLADVSALAIEASRRTIAANALENTRIVASDLFSALAGERFDHIVCNPPFHRGIDTEYEVTRQLIERAPDHLIAGGALWLVVNRFRKYVNALEESLGGECERVAADRRYIVYRAKGPPRGRRKSRQRRRS